MPDSLGADPVDELIVKGKIRGTGVTLLEWSTNWAPPEGEPKL